MNVNEDDEMEIANEFEDSDIEVLDEDNHNPHSESVCNGEQENKGPVLSLACLYEDDKVPLASGSNAVESDDTNNAESSGSVLKNILLNNSQKHLSSESSSDIDEPDIIEIDDVPELMIKSVEENSQDSESSGDDSDIQNLVIDMAEVPELMIKSVEDNFQESSSSTPGKDTESSSDEDSGDSENSSQLIVKTNRRVATRERGHSSSMNNSDENDTIVKDIIDIAEESDLIMRPFNVDHSEHRQLVPISKMPQPVLPIINKTSSNMTSSSVHGRNVFEGKHKFKLLFGTRKDQKSEAYSESRNKLYVAKDYPVQVLVSAENVPADCGIRVCAAFIHPEYSHEVIRRCPAHSQRDKNKGNPTYEHLVLNLGFPAVYENNGNVLSVTVPYEKPHDGEEFTAYLYKLTCFSSCVGGINRRPFMLIFTLEKDGIALGRQTVEVKVCACPLRDYQIEKKKDSPKSSNKERSTVLRETLTGGSNSVQERQILPRETENYLITVKDPELCLFLRQMKTFYEANAIAEQLQNTAKHPL